MTLELLLAVKKIQYSLVQWIRPEAPGSNPMHFHLCLFVRPTFEQDTGSWVCGDYILIFWDW